MHKLYYILEKGHVQLVCEALRVIAILMAHGELSLTIDANSYTFFHTSENFTSFLDEDLMLSSLINVLKDGEPLGLRIIVLLAAQGRNVVNMVVT